MIDPNEIIAACSNLSQLGEQTSGPLTTPFLAGTPAMTVDPSATSSSVISNVQNIGQTMMGQMNSIQASITQQLNTHQQNQSQQSPKDFQPNMADLRNATSHGFPNEMANEFFAKFIPK